MTTLLDGQPKERPPGVHGESQHVADGAYLIPTAGEADGDDRDDDARIQFNWAVNRAGAVKLTARG